VKITLFGADPSLHGLSLTIGTLKGEVGGYYQVLRFFAPLATFPPFGLRFPWPGPTVGLLKLITLPSLTDHDEKCGLVN